METAEKTNTSRVINIVFFLLLALILISGYLFISNTLRGEAAEMGQCSQQERKTQHCSAQQRHCTATDIGNGGNKGGQGQRDK